MPEGRIGRFFEDRGFGFIEPDAGGKAVFFHVESAGGIPLNELRPGTRVSYDTEMGPRGVRARNVRLTDRPAGEKPQPQARGAAGPGYRFLNPYNFVRPLKVENAGAARLLGRCPPPPHDRQVGLTGRITCTLTATTPLFVADSEVPEGVEVREDPRDHYHYWFFSYGGRRAIPGSSVRGAVRGVFEAVTSSCFSVFDGNRRLSYHLPPGDALALVPARTVQRAGGWELELLPGTTTLAIGQRPQGPQYAAWVMEYDPMQPSRSKGSAPASPYSRRRKIDLAPRGLRHRFRRCQALVEQVEHPVRRFSFWNVVDVAPPDAPALRPATGSQQRRVEGYLCITNQNIENKHDERLFFDASGKPLTVSLPAPLVHRYDDLVADYQERHAAEVERRRRRGVSVDAPDGGRAGLSWFVYERTGEEEKLRDGDLVYAMLKGSASTPEVDFIVPVSVPRVGYEQTIGDLLDPVGRDRGGMAEPCIAIDELCPACRVFGWVGKTADEEQAQIAHAGRVRFGYASLVGEPRTLDDPAAGIPLAILSGPKPTTTRFYLAPEDGRPEDGLEDQDTGYDAKRRRLRGRKFYRHQGMQLSKQEYRSAGGPPSDQNRTVHGVLASGSTFRFTVHFENLAAIELGALLWSLEMDGWHHRLGLGKPLGFGSARVAVTALEVVDPDVRYASLDPGWRDGLEHKKAWVERFQKAMAERYGKSFADLENIRDLKALLADDPKVPVHYPRPTLEPHPEGRNYEWFMGNKRTGRDAGPRLALPLADEDHAGLPLMDRYGRTPPSR